MGGGSLDQDHVEEFRARMRGLICPVNQKRLSAQS